MLLLAGLLLEHRKHLFCPKLILIIVDNFATFTCYLNVKVWKEKERKWKEKYTDKDCYNWFF